ncbi:MAG: HAD family hydrolase [Ardenticatenales bacterium]|nr:HAD family hydrolase [Ardenticatenales bacterium]
MAEREAALVAKRAPPAPPPARTRLIEEIRGFILDMDGVLYRGNTVREGTLDFIHHLNAAGLPYLCLTNNASRTSAMYEEKLGRLGLPIKGEHVMGAAQATAEWLRARAVAGARVLPLGEAGLREELSKVGFTLVEQPPADYVVVGIDFELTYERLKQATLAIRGNAQFVGTNPDRTFPSEEGLLPGNGAALAYLEAATGVAPIIIGKPSVAIMEVALAHLGLPAEQVAMVGDRLDTDILGGQHAGLMTILVRGGVTSEAELATSPIQPDLVVDDLGALLARVAPERQANLANSTPSK